MARLPQRLDALPARDRALFCQKGGVVWILHVCKKQDQDAGIGAARARMKKL